MRKVLSFVLVLALVLSSFSMAFAADTTPAAVEAPATTTAPVVTTPAPAVTGTNTGIVANLSDIDGNANVEAIEVANNLGIVTGNPDGTFTPEKAVNRAEFAAMITRSLGIPQSALAGYTKVSFKDCNGYGWAVPYLAFCESKGIMKGDGQGNVMPGRTINTNEAATMLMRAVGYTDNSSALVGMWPSNYVSLAQDKGIYDDVTKDATVDKADAAQMVYNALSVQKVQVAADGTTNQLTNKVLIAGVWSDEPTTMLISGLNCSQRTGTVGAYNLVTYEEEAVIATIPHLGELARLYDNKDGNLIVIDDIQTTTMKGKLYKLAAGATVDSNTYFKVDGVKYYFNTTSIPQMNAGMVKFLNADANAAYAYKEGETITINAETSNKTITQAYSVEKEIVTGKDIVADTDLEQIKKGKLLGFEFATDKKEQIIQKSFQLIGVKSLEEIKDGNVVYVYTEDNKSGNEVRKVAVGTEIVEGKVVKTNADDEEWTINGKVYAFSGEGDAYASELDNTVKVWLDAYGDIYEYEVLTGAAKDYAVVEATDLAGFDRVKLYLSTDAEKTLNVDLNAAKKAVLSTAQGKRLVGYGLDKDGVMDGIYPAVANNINGQYMATAATLAGIRVMDVTGTAINVGPKTNLVIDTNVTVFERDAAFEITGVAKIADVDDKTNLGKVEYLVRDDKVVAMIVDEQYIGGSSSDVYALVGKAEPVVANDHKAQALTGFVAGKLVEGTVYTASTETIDSAFVGGAAPTVLKVNYNKDSEISRVTTVAVSQNADVTKKASMKDNMIQLNNVDYAVASNALYVEREQTDKGAFDQYSNFSGSIYVGSTVWLFETDKDSAGYDIVVIDATNSVSAYTMSVSIDSQEATVSSAVAVAQNIATLSAVSSTTTSGFTWGAVVIDQTGVTTSAVTATATPGPGSQTVVSVDANKVLGATHGAVLTVRVTATDQSQTGNTKEYKDIKVTIE